MVLAQVDPSTVAQGFAKDLNTALAWGLALALFAVAFLVRQVLTDREKHAAEIAALNKAARDDLRADAREQREILQQIVPLAAKLVEGVETIERLTESLTEEG